MTVRATFDQKYGREKELFRGGRLCGITDRGSSSMGPRWRSLSPTYDVGDHARRSQRDHDRKRGSQPSGVGAMAEDAADLRTRYRRKHEEHDRQVAPDDHAGRQSEDMEHQGNEDERAPLPDQPPQKADHRGNRYGKGDIEPAGVRILDLMFLGLRKPHHQRGDGGEPGEDDHQYLVRHPP